MSDTSEKLRLAAREYANEWGTSAELCGLMFKAADELSSMTAERDELHSYFRETCIQLLGHLDQGSHDAAENILRNWLWENEDKQDERYAEN
jgi:hypothetical protein